MNKCIANCNCGRHNNGGNNKGILHSQETKEKISRTMKSKNSHPIHTIKSCGKAHAACSICKPDYQKSKIIISYDSENPPMKSIVRRLLITSMGEEKCNCCGWKERRTNGACPLELHHKDGNHDNWRWENVELLCPNCHSLTPKYRRYKLVPSEGVEPSA